MRCALFIATIQCITHSDTGHLMPGILMKNAVDEAAQRKNLKRFCSADSERDTLRSLGTIAQRERNPFEYARKLTLVCNRLAKRTN